MKSELAIIMFILGFAGGMYFNETRTKEVYKQDLEYSAGVKQAIRNCELAYTIPRPCKPVYDAVGVNP